jgi:hypothetical protein
MILTKAPACLVPASGYTNTLAEPGGYRVNKGKVRCTGYASDHLWAHQDASDTADPRLGTRMSLAQGLELTNVGAFD